MELLASSEREVLYGGAAGASKTAALVLGALQYVQVPGYNALILRRELEQLKKPDSPFNLACQWLLGREVEGEMVGLSGFKLTFPSGATLSFGHIQHEKSKFNFDGSAYQFVAFDELCHFTESMYGYLFGRQRKRLTGDVSQIPIRMWASAMPGGPGHDWVKRRFVVPYRENKMPTNRKFIPATLNDNPFIDVEDYRRTFAVMKEVDPITARKMEEGDWDALVGSRFKSEWFRYYKRVPWSGTTTHLIDCRGQIINLELVGDRFLTVDPASTAADVAKPDPDYTVISAWAMTPNGYLIWLGCWRDRIELPDIPEKVWLMYRKYRASLVQVEDTGQAKMSQWLERYKSPSGEFMNVLPYSKGGRDKLAENTPGINMMAAGRVWMPMDDPDFPLSDVETEMLLFTGNEKLDAHDDIIDTLGQAARRSYDSDGDPQDGGWPELMVPGRPMI